MFIHVQNIKICNEKTLKLFGNLHDFRRLVSNDMLKIAVWTVKSFIDHKQPYIIGSPLCDIIIELHVIAELIFSARASAVYTNNVVK